MSIQGVTVLEQPATVPPPPPMPPPMMMRGASKRSSSSSSGGPGRSPSPLAPGRRGSASAGRWQQPAAGNGDVQMSDASSRAGSLASTNFDSLSEITELSHVSWGAKLRRADSANC